MNDGALAKIILLVLMVPITALLNAWVLTLLWGWFLVPFGLPSIGVAHAYGLSVLVTFLNYNAKRSYLDSQEDMDWFVFLVLSVVAPLLALLLGWVAQGFM